MADVLRPRHLGDVDETLDTFLELHERAVVGDRDHLPADLHVDGELFLDVFPRVLGKLLESQRDALALQLEVEDLDGQFVADRHELGWVADAPPAHVGYVKKSVDTTEVDEGTEVRDVLDDALSDLSDLELGEESRFLLLAFLLEYDAPRYDYVPPPLVDLEDSEAELLAEQFLQIGNAPQSDLGTGQERLDAEEVDLESALDPALGSSLDDGLLVVGLLDLVPDLQEVGLPLADPDLTVLVLGRLEQHADLVARLDGVRLGELVERHSALGFETDVEQNLVVCHGENEALHEFALGDRTESRLVHLGHLLVLVPSVAELVEVVLGHGRDGSLESGGCRLCGRDLRVHLFRSVFGGRVFGRSVFLRLRGGCRIDGRGLLGVAGRLIGRLDLGRRVRGLLRRVQGLGLRLCGRLGGLVLRHG